jgi:hypothetical protein
MADSKALKRVKKHRIGGASRDEGIWLSLDHLDTLTNFLRTNPDAIAQGINAVAFMIGKEVGPVEYTVEVLPFNKNPLNGSPSTGTLMIDAIGTTGILDVPGFPISNNGGGGGGNQKTPPPTT